MIDNFTGIVFKHFTGSCWALERVLEDSTKCIKVSLRGSLSSHQQF